MEKLVKLSDVEEMIESLSWNEEDKEYLLKSLSSLPTQNVSDDYEMPNSSEELRDFLDKHGE